MNQIEALNVLIKLRGEGLDIVDKLIAEMEKAGLETDHFKSRANELNKELGNLKSQQELIAQFRSQKDAVAYAADAYEKAQQAAQKMARELSKVEEPTRKQTADFDKAREAVKSADQAYQEAQQKLQALRSQLQDVGISSTNLAEANRRIKQEVDGANASISKLTQEAMQAAQAQQTMGKLGVRSAAEIEAEIARVKEAMQALQGQSTLSAGELKTAMAAGKTQVADLERELRGVTGQLTLMDQVSRALKGTMGAVFGGNLLTMGAMAAANAVRGLAQDFIESNLEAQRLTKSLDAIYKSGGTTATQIRFLRKTANEAGLDVRALADQFISFSASTKEANIPLEISNDLFSTIAKAGATLGLSNERVSLSLLALGQMASKGTVSMEELRMQLGEDLPGALGLVAKGLGVTESQLIKLVENGGLAARDLFPALASSLKSMVGTTDTTAGAWNRMKNAVTETLQAMGDSGGTGMMTDAIKTLGVVVGLVLTPLHALVETIFLGAHAAGALAASLAIMADTSMNSKAKIAALRDVWADMGEQYRKADERVTKTAGILEASIGTTKAHTEATSGSTKASAEFARQMVALGVATAEQVKKQEQVIKNSEKLAEAAKIEGESLVQLAKMRGNDRQELDAEVTAAQGNAVAMQKVADARKAMLDTLQKEYDRKMELIGQNPAELKAREADIKAMQQKIETAKAEAEASAQAAAATKMDVAQKEMSRKAYEDNSLNVGKLKSAMDVANRALATAEMLEKGHLLTKEALADAQRRAAVATGLYKDALADSVTRVESLARTQKTLIDVQQTGLSIQMQAAQAMQREAELNRDARGYKEALLKQKSIEIEQLRLSIKVKVAEADATIAQTKATMAELYAKGKLTDIKRAELDAAIKLAEAKKEEAKGLEKSVDLMKKEREQIERTSYSVDASGKIVQETWAGNARAAQGYGSTVSQVMGEAISEIDRQNQELEKTNAILEKQAELKRKAAGVDKDGFSTDKNGNRLTMGSDIHTRTGIVNFLKGAGVDDEAVARKIASEAADSKGDVILMDNPLQKKYGADTLSMALLKAAEQYTFAAGHAAGKTTSGTSSAAVATAPAAASMPSSASTSAAASTVTEPVSSSRAADGQVQRTYHIHIAGIGAVQTDEAGAGTIDELMRQLEQGRISTGRSL